MSQAKRVTMYTDGACSGNPGPGGWGVVLKWDGHEKELSGGEAETTNNRMELMAAIEGLAALKRAVGVDLYTDSEYVKNGMTQWIHGWRRNGWRTASKDPVKNADLWQRLEQEVARHDVAWHWVKGHAGEETNERVDQLARAALQPFKPKKKAAGAPEA